MSFRTIPAALLLSLAVSPALAQEAACPVTTPLAAAAAPSGLDASAVKPGETVQAALRPSVEVAFQVPPQKPGAAGSYSGMVTVAIATAGTYRIGLGDGAWIDVVQDGAVIRSTAHSHGANCLAKLVDFPLQPGRAVIEISGAPQPTTRLLVARVP